MAGALRFGLPLAGPLAAFSSISTAAYWFTSSTSFANPAITIARSLTDTFSGIAQADVPMFIAAQLAGAIAASWAGQSLFADDFPINAGLNLSRATPGIRENGDAPDSRARHHRSCQIEAIQVHHLRPRRNKIADKFFLRIVRAIDFGEPAQDRV